jgi:hypothetical protein
MSITLLSVHDITVFEMLPVSGSKFITIDKSLKKNDIYVNYYII